MGTIIVKPVVSKEKDSNGLAELNLNSFPGSVKESPVPIKNGKFLSGFDVNAFYISKMSQKDREKEINRIKQVCEEYDREFPELRICDCTTTNSFYNDMVINIKASGQYFDSNNINDIVKLSVIKTNALYTTDSLIAASYQDALNSNRFKFYISDEELDIEEEVKDARQINAAISTLDRISAEDVTRTMLVTKYLFPANKSYNSEKSTRIYKRLNDFIKGIVDGETAKDSVKTNYQRFLKAVNIPLEEIITKVVIKYAIHLNIIRQNRDKEYVYLKSGQLMGKSGEELFNFLFNLKNTDIYSDIKADVENEIKIY